ncbi:MAG: T9SS type A sorting domain-containing protein [Ignavibacteriae bacterium]|nr:T9SS C-terminal target domain-containing protein [Ignavibacteriota bacterium]NOG98636.1 T9SS type A sorting domain-containing protein [Ignavibacteriota bacterium]
MNYWVNETWSSNPIQGSLTHYFNEMSFNKLKFIGKTVSVITPNSRQWYLTNSKDRGYIHKEVIQQLDNTWDFAEFDKWDLISAYNHTDDRTDGVIEMIIMVWRNVAKEFPEPQQNNIYTALDFHPVYSYGSLGGSEFQVDGGARTVKTGFSPSGSTPGGSGVTINDHLINQGLTITIHEFAHYLMGGNSYHTGHGFWGMLDAWGKKSKVANSFERYRLGWINVNDIENTPNQVISNATISDYVTTGIVYRFKVDPTSNEYFYIENHQKLSYWETHLTPGNIENGIYVLRQKGTLGKDVQIIPADGRFDWVVNQITPNPWGSGNLPVYKNNGADRVNGYHDLQTIPWVWNGINQAAQVIHFTENESGQPVLDVRYPGDGRDAFREGFNEIFTPYSNPNSHRFNRTATPFGFKINSLVGGVYSLDIYVNTSLNAQPSKPQNLKVTIENNTPRLNWAANIEPDVVSGGKYKVYRTTTSGGEPTSYSHVATVNHPATTWLDYNYYVYGGGDSKLFYTVSAVDSDNMESVKSDYDWLWWDNELQKNGDQSTFDNNIITDYRLFSNYPNPFNPETIIKYQIPESGLVQLKIYDLLGRDVATLVNEVKSAGSYSINFDASDLPSGVYIYSLRVNDYVQNQKMTLLK